MLRHVGTEWLAERLMCCSCGRCLRTDIGFAKCPFCGGLHATPNVRNDIPEKGVEQAVHFPCGHSIRTEYPGDVRCCPACGCEFAGVGLRLRDWQKSVLQKLGLWESEFG